MRKRIGIYRATEEARQLIPSLLENPELEIAAIFDPDAESIRQRFDTMQRGVADVLSSRLTADLETLQSDSGVMARVSSVGQLLSPIPADKLTWGGGGADIGPLMRKGVPGFGLRTVGEKYFHWHHTEADTLDKIRKEDFQGNTAALAVLAYVLAEMPERFGDYLSP